jgi:hypothetical protein
MRRHVNLTQVHSLFVQRLGEPIRRATYSFVVWVKPSYSSNIIQKSDRNGKQQWNSKFIVPTRILCKGLVLAIAALLPRVARHQHLYLGSLDRPDALREASLRLNRAKNINNNNNSQSTFPPELVWYFWKAWQL